MSFDGRITVPGSDIMLYNRKDGTVSFIRITPKGGIINLRGQTQHRFQPGWQTCVAGQFLAPATSTTTTTTTSTRLSSSGSGLADHTVDDLYCYKGQRCASMIYTDAGFKAASTTITETVGWNCVIPLHPLERIEAGSPDDHQYEREGSVTVELASSLYDSGESAILDKSTLGRTIYLYPVDHDPSAIPTSPTTEATMPAAMRTSSPDLEAPTQEDSPECVVCKRLPRNCLLFPCGHVAVCEDCGETLLPPPPPPTPTAPTSQQPQQPPQPPQQQPKGGVCPLADCGMPVEDVMKLFDPK
jgi:hypothetical protein